MQILVRTSSDVEAYISAREWTVANLPACPLHPEGGCGIARHGSYARAKPAGVRVARWYCPRGHCTFSLLPHFLAARMPGLLVEIEEAFAAATRLPSIEATASSIRDPEISLTSAVRWLRRRILPVRRAIQALRDANTETPLVADAGFLTRLRLDLDGSDLAHLPAPLGFQSRRAQQQDVVTRDVQHKMGPGALKRTSYPGRQHNRQLQPVVWSRDLSSQYSLNARPPPGTSCVCGTLTPASVRAPLGSTCIGSAGSDATAMRSGSTSPTN